MTGPLLDQLRLVEAADEGLLEVGRTGIDVYIDQAQVPADTGWLAAELIAAGLLYLAPGIRPSGRRALFVTGRGRKLLAQQVTR